MVSIRKSLDMLELADTDLLRNDGDTLAVPVMTTRRFVRLLWLLSGIPIGVALIFLTAEARLAWFTLFALLETGHSLSPIVLEAQSLRSVSRRVSAGPRWFMGGTMRGE